MTQPLLDRIRTLIQSGRMSRAGLARAAGLHGNTLRDCLDAGWNPTSDTLGKLERFLAANDDRPALASIEEIIEEARNGRMFILVDDEDRENEGDLIIPAQMATPASVAFMATHGRGLICLCLTSERCDQLGLEPMARKNGTPLGTAFTVSIEARDGITTGISAADRARTVQVAIDTANGPQEIVSPGHVFPLRARAGGVMVRAGHTEAGVDVARLAGLNPSAVICEIMRDDGRMARLDDLIPYARLHGLKIGTIRDLIAYRRKHDRMVERSGEYRFTSRIGGDWTAIAFRNRADGEETLALVKGHIDPARPTLVRMHSLSIFPDIFAEESARTDLLKRSMDIIAAAGSGVLVLINRTMRMSLARVAAAPARARDAEDTAIEELRDYGIGAQILAELDVHDMILLSNTHHSLVALEGYGLSIVEERRID